MSRSPWSTACAKPRPRPRSGATAPQHSSARSAATPRAGSSACSTSADTARSTASCRSCSTSCGRWCADEPGGARGHRRLDGLDAGLGAVSPHPVLASDVGRLPARPAQGARLPARARGAAMRALTLTQPWASLVVSGQKRIENRPWNPPTAMIGQRFAIHASRAIDLDTTYEIFISKIYGPVVSPYPTPRDFPLSAVVGVATLDKVFSGSWDAEAIERHAALFSFSTGEFLGPQQVRWFFGPVGFALRDARAIATPVPCKGALGFWTLPEDVERAVAAQLEEQHHG